MQIVGEPCGVDHDARCKLTPPSPATTNSKGDTLIIVGAGALVLAAMAAIAVVILHRVNLRRRRDAYHTLEMSATPVSPGTSLYPRPSAEVSVLSVSGPPPTTSGHAGG